MDTKYDKTLDEIMKDREPGTVWCETEGEANPNNLYKMKPYYSYGTNRHSWNGPNEYGAPQNYEANDARWREIPDPTVKVELPEKHAHAPLANKIIDYLASEPWK